MPTSGESDCLKRIVCVIENGMSEVRGTNRLRLRLGEIEPLKKEYTKVVSGHKGEIVGTRRLLGACLNLSYLKQDCSP